MVQLPPSNDWRIDLTETNIFESIACPFESNLQVSNGKTMNQRIRTQSRLFSYSILICQRRIDIFDLKIDLLGTLSSS